jgi:hypothetical protein
MNGVTRASRSLSRWLILRYCKATLQWLKNYSHDPANVTEMITFECVLLLHRSF